MAFRQHNPNLVTHRQKGGQRWNNTKTNRLVAPLHHGANKASLPSNQPNIQHQGELLEANEATSIYWGSSSFFTDNISHHNAENMPTAANLTSIATTSQSSTFYRLPTFNRDQFRQGIYNTLSTDSPRLSPDVFRLEKINRLGQKSKSGDSSDCERSKPSKSIGNVKYVEAARSHTSVQPTTTSTMSPSLTIFEDVDRTHNQNFEAASPSKSLHSYMYMLHKLSDVGDCQSAKESELLLLEMIEKYKVGLHDFQPDGACYNRYVVRLQLRIDPCAIPLTSPLPNISSVIHAYAEAGLPNQAENVMRLMFSDFKNGNKLAEPNVRCLTRKLIRRYIVL